ncbi:MAG: hypothetical protein AAFQ32_00805 [Pseudomonadota bacterium]
MKREAEARVRLFELDPELEIELDRLVDLDRLDGVDAEDRLGELKDDRGLLDELLERLGDREVLRLTLLVVLDRLGELYELPLMDDV